MNQGIRCEYRKRRPSRTLAITVAIAVIAVLPGRSYSIPMTHGNTFLSPTSIDIPAALGHVDESFEGETDRLVIYLQDAHANYGAQKNISSIIRHLSETYEIDLLATEGAEGELDVSLFRSFPFRGTAREVLDRHMRSGAIGGPEFTAAVGDREIDFVGVDRQKLYLKNVSEFMKVLEVREDGLRFVKNIETAFKNVRDTIYSKEHRALDRLIAAYHAEVYDLSTFASELGKAARRSGVDVSPFHELDSFFRVLGEAEDERSQADLDTYISGLDPDRLLQEIEALSLRMKLHYSTTKTERKLIQLERYLILLKRGFALALTRREAAELDARSKELTTKRMLGYVQSVVDAYRLRDDTIRRAEGIPFDDYVGRILDFYRTTRARDRAFSKRLSREMARRRVSRSILVTGGFHRAGVTGLLKKNGISFLVVIPKIEDVPPQERYLGLMRRQAELMKSPTRNALGLMPSPAHSPAALRLTQTIFHDLSARLDSPELAGLYKDRHAFVVFRNPHTDGPEALVVYGFRRSLRQGIDPAAALMQNAFPLSEPVGRLFAGRALPARDVDGGFGSGIRPVDGQIKAQVPVLTSGRISERPGPARTETSRPAGTGDIEDTFEWSTQTRLRSAEPANMRPAAGALETFIAQLRIRWSRLAESVAGLQHVIRQLLDRERLDRRPEALSEDEESELKGITGRAVTPSAPSFETSDRNGRGGFGVTASGQREIPVRTSKLVRQLMAAGQDLSPILGFPPGLPVVIRLDDTVEEGFFRGFDFHARTGALKIFLSGEPGEPYREIDIDASRRIRIAQKAGRGEITTAGRVPTAAEEAEALFRRKPGLRHFADLVRSGAQANLVDMNGARHTGVVVGFSYSEREALLKLLIEGNDGVMSEALFNMAGHPHDPQLLPQAGFGRLRLDLPVSNFTGTASGRLPNEPTESMPARYGARKPGRQDSAQSLATMLARAEGPDMIADAAEKFRFARDVKMARDRARGMTVDLADPAAILVSDMEVLNAFLHLEGKHKDIRDIIPKAKQFVALGFSAWNENDQAAFKKMASEDPDRYVWVDKGGLKGLEFHASVLPLVRPESLTREVLDDLIIVQRTVGYSFEFFIQSAIADLVQDMVAVYRVAIAA